MEAFSTYIAIDNYVTGILTDDIKLKSDQFVILSLRSKTGLSNIKNSIEKAAKEKNIQNIFEWKENILHYFLVFKNIEKEEVLNAMNKLMIFEKVSENEILEFTIKDKKYYAVRIEFEID